MITNFKFQGTTSLVGVALLMGLGGQDIGMNLLHLLFCLRHNIGAKDNPFVQLSGVLQGCPKSALKGDKLMLS
jgi:hypothetical protein